MFCCYNCCRLHSNGGRSQSSVTSPRSWLLICCLCSRTRDLANLLGQSRTLGHILDVLFPGVKRLLTHTTPAFMNKPRSRRQSRSVPSFTVLLISLKTLISCSDRMDSYYLATHQISVNTEAKTGVTFSSTCSRILKVDFL